MQHINFSQVIDSCGNQIIWKQTPNYLQVYICSLCSWFIFMFLSRALVSVASPAKILVYHSIYGLECTRNSNSSIVICRNMYSPHLMWGQVVLSLGWIAGQADVSGEYSSCWLLSAHIGNQHDQYGLSTVQSYKLVVLFLKSS